MFTHRVITAIVGIPLVLIGLYCGGALWQLIVFFFWS